MHDARRVSTAGLHGGVGVVETVSVSKQVCQQGVLAHTHTTMDLCGEYRVGRPHTTQLSHAHETTSAIYDGLMFGAMALTTPSGAVGTVVNPQVPQASSAMSAASNAVHLPGACTHNSPHTHLNSCINDLQRHSWCSHLCCRYFTPCCLVANPAAQHSTMGTASRMVSTGTQQLQS